MHEKYLEHYKYKQILSFPGIPAIYMTCGIMIKYSGKKKEAKTGHWNH